MAVIGAAMVTGPLMFNAISKAGMMVALFIADGLIVLALIVIILFMVESVDNPLCNTISTKKRKQLNTELGVHKSLSLIQKINPFRTWGVIISRKNPFVTTLAFVYFLYALSVSDVIDTALMYTEVRYGWTTSQYMFYSSFTGALFALFQGFAMGPMSKSMGERKLLIFALCAGVIGRAGFAFAPSQWVFVGFGAFSATVSATIPTITAIVTSNVPTKNIGGAISAMSSLFALCQFVGALSMENVFAYFISPRAIIYFPGAHFVIGSLLILMAVITSLILFSKYSAGSEKRFLVASGDIEKASLLNRDQDNPQDNLQDNPHEPYTMN